MKPYFNIAKQYAIDVTEGDIIACKQIKQTCQRFLDDLENDKLEFIIDESEGNRACSFVELLPHIKGNEARLRNKFVLQPWQVFIVFQLHAWVDKVADHEGMRYRRFRNAFIFVPRKNGKTFLASAIAIYHLCACNEAGAEVYFAAPNNNQSKLGYGTASAMINRSPGLMKRFGVVVNKYQVSVEETNSIMAALSKDNQGSLDGKNPSCCVLDEIAVHKNRGVIEAMQLGIDARKQPLLIGITTAGSDLSGIAMEMQGYNEKILDGIIKDERSFSMIFTIDKDDDWLDPEVWAKANPNMGISFEETGMQQAALRAETESGAENDFKTKRLNMWVSNDQAFLNMTKWQENADPLLFIEQFKDQECRVAIDLASKIDITALVIMFEYKNGYAMFSKSYLPEDAIQTANNSSYAGWVHDGSLIATPGSRTDYAFLIKDILELAKDYKIIEVISDQYSAGAVLQELQNADIPTLEIPNNARTLSEPLKNMDAHIISGDLAHDGNSCMTWQMGNLVAKTDAYGNLKPSKPNNRSSKIDVAVAAIMCFARVNAEKEEKKSSVYDSDDWESF